MAHGTWVDESLLARLQNARYFSLLADEYTDITTIEELSVVCRWVENGLPVEHFIEIIPLKPGSECRIALRRDMMWHHMTIAPISERPIMSHHTSLRRKDRFEFYFM